MKDILFIGGPKTVQGVDRIEDDLVSVLSAEGLYDRKAVVVWPTERFLAEPEDPKRLDGVCHEELAELIAIYEKKQIPFGGVSVDQYRKLAAEIRKDTEAMEAARDVCVRSQAYAALSRLVLAVTGGQNLVVVISASATTKAVSWLTHPSWFDHGRGQSVKAYKSSDSGYGVLNAVKDWPFAFPGFAPGSVKAGDLVPQDTFSFNGEKVYYDRNSYMGVENALTAEVEVSFPVTDRFGSTRAVKVSSDNGYMLVVPEPDKIRNFIIGLKTAPVAKPKAEEAQIPKASKLATDKYLKRKEVAELLKKTPRTIDRWREQGKLEAKEINGNILILKSSVDKLLEG